MIFTEDMLFQEKSLFLEHCYGTVETRILCVGNSCLLG